jgi:NADH-quinone oxidoreductase subunit M
LPLAALIYLLTVVSTASTKVRRFSFAETLACEAILLATLSTKQPWVLIALLALGTIQPLIELRARKKPARVFALHMGMFVALLVAGWTIVELEGPRRVHSLWAVAPLMLAVFVRCTAGSPTCSSTRPSARRCSSSPA